MAVTRSTIPTIAEIRDRVLNDIKRGKIRAGVPRPNVAPGSESYIKAEAWGASAMQLAANIAVQQDATMPDSAVDEDLDRLADIWKGFKRSTGVGASGFVKVNVSGTVTFAAGQEGTFDDGVRAQVTVTTTASNNSLVPIRCIDIGKQTDRASGTKFTWSSPPSGSATVAYVDTAGLNDGKDPDDDSALRARLLSALRHPAQSGSWAHYAQWAEDSSPSVQKGFVFPALQGPSTVHVAIIVEADADNYYTREASAVLVNTAALEIVSNSPEHADTLTTKCADEEKDVVLCISLPAHEVDGGTGGGWLNASSERWPAVGGTTPYATNLSAAPLSGTRIRVNTYSEPTDDAYIAIWSNSHKQFQHTRIKSHSLVSGSVYELVLWTSIDTNKIASGDYVSPDAEKLDDYGVTVAGAFATLGPGEKTTTAGLLPRSYRHPLNTEEWGYQFTSKHLGTLSTQHDEIGHVSVTSPTLPASPSLPAAVTDPPNVLVIGDLAFYPT